MTSHELKQNLRQLIQYANTSRDHGEMPVTTLTQELGMGFRCFL